MPASIVPFPRQPLGQYLRVGRAHRQLEYLLEADRLPINRAVFEASLVSQQTEFIRDLGARRVELVLDTNVAELSSEGRFDGAVRNAPWALGERPLGHGDFTTVGLRKMARQIAVFAVENGFDAIISPTHLIQSDDDRWAAIDLKSLEALREELDKAGGASVAIDFELIMPYALLRNEVAREKISRSLSGAPFENLWFRVSGIGRDSTGMAVKRYIDALREFSPSKGSVIVDHIAGLGALATLAFGAAGGVAHGIGERERFDATGWIKRLSGGGGGSRRVLVSALDRQITMSDLAEIEKVPGGRRLLACADATCCPRGIRDMYENERGHYAYQRHKQVTELSRISAPGRADYFVSKMLRPTESKARAASRLKINNESIAASLKRDSERIERMSVLFENEAALSNGLQSAQGPRLRKQSSSLQKGSK
jgi:hypothetical protein